MAMGLLFKQIQHWIVNLNQIFWTRGIVSKATQMDLNNDLDISFQGIWIMKVLFLVALAAAAVCNVLAGKINMNTSHMWCVWGWFVPFVAVCPDINNCDSCTNYGVLCDHCVLHTVISVDRTACLGKYYGNCKFSPDWGTILCGKYINKEKMNTIILAANDSVILYKSCKYSIMFERYFSLL